MWLLYPKNRKYYCLYPNFYYFCYMKARLRDLGEPGIYLIRNIVNGKVYVGKAKCIHSRIKQHITSLNRKQRTHENDHFINAWHKYKRESFDYVVLEYLPLNDKLISSREIFYIDLYNALDNNKGYNKRYDSSTGLIVSEETKLKLSISRQKRDEKFPNLKKENSIKTIEFWKNNPLVLKEMAKKVANAIRKYKIGKFDRETNELIEVFDTRQHLSEKYPDYYIQAILGCCQGTKKSYKNFYWKYISIETGEIQERSYDYKPKNKQ